MTQIIEHDTLVKLSQERPLVFRTQAAAILARVPRRFRRDARVLNRSKRTMHDMLTAWRDEWLPRLETITSAHNATMLQQALQEDLLAETSSQQRLIAMMIPVRLEEERLAFAGSQFTSRREKKPYQRTLAFTQQPIEVCRQQVEDFMRYELYRAVLGEVGMTVVDKRARGLVRCWQRLRAGRQVKKLRREVTRRLAAIEREMTAIEQERGGLAARLFGLNIDYVTVLAARQEYEKALGRLSKKAAESPAKRLALYEKKTEAIREEYLDTVPGVANLSEAQRAVKEIDSVLLAIFDLDATARNELMGAFKRYRTLTRERDMLRAKLEV